MLEDKANTISLSRVIAFAGGITVLLVALQSPIDFISEDLFSVHMCQHLLLTLAAPPRACLERLPDHVHTSAPT